MDNSFSPPPSSVSPGPKAVDYGLGPTAHLHHWHIQHHRRVGHRGVERDPPQDRIRLQPDWPWLSWPQLPGQRLDRAVGPGGGRGQPKRLMFGWADAQEHNPPCPHQLQECRGSCMMVQHAIDNSLLPINKIPCTRDGTRVKETP